jgi:hypothetical protein
MSTSYDLPTITLLVSLSMLAVEETRARCQDQLPRLYNQREVLRANRRRRLEWQAKQRDELRELYTSPGLLPLYLREPHADLI